MNRWVEAARPRTLPLAVASIMLGNMLAYSQGTFDWIIAILAILTTVALQVLSNFANDFGDSMNGVDNQDRKVALRAVQTGKINREEMKKGVVLTATLSFFMGVGLLAYSLQDTSWDIWMKFLSLGVACIAAAIAYTVGKRPYGYMGLGDLSVFLFFGLVGTMGSYFLQTKTLPWHIALPAAGCGLLSVAVLNLNNLRDLENDKRTGKYSIPVRIGKTLGFYYQKALLFIGILPFASYHLIAYQVGASTTSNLLILLGYYPLIIMLRELNPNMTPAEIDPYLKKTALRTLLLILLFGISEIIQ
ncbi:MAG: 1,4-dihydroxy-2-naphthoate octaprenyltransferase [Bacteroidota bacterium]|jgi:1,4-dihydroxy-2-naphthoate octaprenyltransferase